MNRQPRNFAVRLFNCFSHLFMVTGVLLLAVMIGGAQQDRTYDAPAASNVPSWTAEVASQFPACEELRKGVIAPAVVVVKGSGETVRITTDKAFALNTDDERANNVWVIGTCA